LRARASDTDDTNWSARDIPPIPTAPSLAASNKGRAMTKTISIYGVQVLLGLIAVAAGYAKLTGTGVMVQQFQTLGLGHGFLMVAGAAEIIAGLCLLLPRGGILGAVLLSCVMVAALGVTIGHVASTVATPSGSWQIAATGQQINAHPWTQGAAPIVIVRQRDGWNI
jgi:uncharacterized membrane protein YphA (DoxX/SURF4 family)